MWRGKGVKGEVLSHSNLALPKMTLSGVRAREQWREPGNGSLNIWVPDPATLTEAMRLRASHFPSLDFSFFI